MPNITSAKKELRKSKKRQEANKVIADRAKILIKKTLKQIEAKEAKVAESFSEVMQSLDKLVKKGILKKNTADRKKSRLQKKINEILKK
jgi:small subunit ribosomal protein S20